MKMKKYDKIKRLGHRSTDGIFEDGKIVATEKLDGNNFRVMLHEDSGELRYDPLCIYLYRGGR